METNQDLIYCAQEYRDNTHADNKTEPEMRRRNFDARRVSKSILNEILCEIHKVNQMRPAPRRIMKIKKMIPKQKDILLKPMSEQEPIPLNKLSSMTSLIIWNISKALEMKPCLELKGSIRAAQQRLDSEERILSSVREENPEQQHLICALLAWQRLGHHDADSLYRFVELQKKDISSAVKCTHKPNCTTNDYRNPAAWEAFVPNTVDGSFGSHTTGPIVKLPVESKVIMFVEDKGSKRHVSCQSAKKKPPKPPEKETLDKFNAACCLDTQCAEKLAAVDAMTNELRDRASQLARREAERVELLERAEAAWRDLEVGYQKRLELAEEKEDDIQKQITKLIADRNEIKCNYNPLANSLKTRKDVVEKEQANLTTLEEKVCSLATTRMRFSDEAAKSEAALAQELCKTAQYDRDLKFEEDQARRKLELLDDEADSARTLTCEAERAMRAELIGLREQVAEVSKELSQEDEKNRKLKEQHEELRQEKARLVGDLEGCKKMCDQKMQGQLDELLEKKEKLLALQEKVLECQCKMPMDQKVQVKRTPSLAAICRCAPEDKFLESCSCTSLRGSILSNLLSDLFGGLQSELGEAGSQMPCQLLKCLEDQHNWDRPSATKSNLRNFFSNLLKSELNIAIATSIENYHAKWVGESCADVAKMIPTLEDDLKQGWQQRAIERRAKKMANQLAEDLFRERSAQVVQRAKDIVQSGPPPCECKPPPCGSANCAQPKPTAMFSCLMPLSSPFNLVTTAKACVVKRHAGEETSPPAYWKQAIQDVTQLKLQIEDLKKDSIKKADLKLMEENIFKLVREASVIKHEDPSADTNDTSKYCGEGKEKETKISRVVSRDQYPKIVNPNKLGAASRDESPKTSNKKKLELTKSDEYPMILNGNKLRAARRDESPKTRRDESPKTSNQNKLGATRKDESLNISNEKKLGAARRDESPRSWRDESPKTSNQNKSGATRRDESPNLSNEKKFGATRRKDGKSLLKKGLIYEKSTKQSKKQVHGQSYAVNLCLCEPQKNSKSLQNAQLNNSGRLSWKQKSLKGIMPQSSIVKQTKPININFPSTELLENDSITSEPCDSNCKCFRKVPSNTSIDKLLQTLTSWKYDLIPGEKCLKNNKNSPCKCSKITIKEAMRILTQNDSTMNLSVSTDKKPVNVNDIYEDAQLRTEKQQVSFLKQPAATASEYMGTVYLDKSQENNCKCITNIKSNKKNNQENSNINIPFQCIDTNICDCKIYQEMQKDHKRSQTEEFYEAQIQSNQCQVVRSKNVPEFSEFNSNPKSGNFINIKKEIKQKSDMSNVPQKTELFSSSSEYFIKFLGVTLDDLSSNRKTQKKIKTGVHNVDSLLMAKDKHVERRRKLPKFSIIEQSTSIMKPNVLTRERNDEYKFNDCTKCECKAKFEEFTSFMNNFFDNKLDENIHKDEVIDLQNIKHTDDKIESCVCCNGVNTDDSRDLEVNAFHLLEDHIREKLEEFRSFSCKSKCIPPEEEEKLFSTILQRVKQVISDCANKMKCGCPGGLPNKGSWNRAYGLLQEYLKIKIKRVQCLCVLNDRKDVILPEVLEKVCNLIENDFQRLKDICTCTNSTEMRTKIVHIGHRVLIPTELPEKDTNISQQYNDAEVQNFSVVAKFSKQNSNNSMILKENISSQVPPNLGMEAKSCDIMQPQNNKNARTTETDYITTDSKSHGVMYNTCDCCHNTDKVDIQNFPELFGTKGVFVNLYAEQATNKSDICEFPKIGINQELPSCLLANRVESKKPIPKIEMNEYVDTNLDAQDIMVNRQIPRTPYIGCTVDCSCDGALGTCFCMKSIVQTNNDKIDSLWKEFLVNNNKNEHFPYIMHGTQNKKSAIIVKCHSVPDDVLTDEASTSAVLNKEDDMVLKHSHDKVNLIHHAVNTVAESVSLATTYSNSDIYPIDWNGNSVPVTSERSNAVKFANSIYFPGLPTDDDENSLISGTATHPVSQKTGETCVCDKVPICHVKMLVEHIEKNLVESKCTCDSLISKVCPVHSKRFN